jgi:hypothetical protein
VRRFSRHSGWVLGCEGADRKISPMCLLAATVMTVLPHQQRLSKETLPMESLALRWLRHYQKLQNSPRWNSPWNKTQGSKLTTETGLITTGSSQCCCTTCTHHWRLRIGSTVWSDLLPEDGAQQQPREAPLERISRSIPAPWWSFPIVCH